MRRLFVLSGLLLCLPLIALAIDETDPLETAVNDLFTARGDQATQAAITSILALDPERGALADLLRKGPAYVQPESSGWSIRTVAYPDGVERPFHVYVPEKYRAGAPMPVLIHMHGGISRAELIPEEGMIGYRDWWTEQADEWGFMVVFPLGQRGSEWWTENGAGGVHRILSELKRDLNVDENRVFATGFSDGGSGAFYFAMTHPTFFAAFIPLNGHPAVASGASGRQLYLVNMRNRPLYIVNTQEDSLYPTVAVLPYLEEMIRAGAQLRFTTYPGIGHSPDYRDEQNPLIARFMADTARSPLPSAITWETADVEVGRAAWLTVLELGETPGAPGFEDHNLMLPEGRVRIGVQIDMEFTGRGTRVNMVVEGSVAAVAGMAVGDVIVGIDDVEIVGMADLRAALGAKRAGEQVRIRFLRGEEERLGEGQFPPYVPKPTFVRDKPSGRIELTVSGNHVEVARSGVRRFALDISPDLFDLEREIVVTVNGREVLRRRVEPDLDFLLRSFARDRDRSMLFAARVVIGE